MVFYIYETYYTYINMICTANIARLLKNQYPIS
nr:MAG TPA: hypothetical protein [Caudoviricetes sp.]